MGCSKQPPDPYNSLVRALAGTIGAAWLAKSELRRVVSVVVFISTSHRCRRFACASWIAIRVPTPRQRQPSDY
jgi:hypothetical protein